MGRVGPIGLYGRATRPLRANGQPYRGINVLMLWGKDDGTFGPYPFSHPADVRFLLPTLRFTNRPYRLWLQRIDAYDENLQAQLDWIDRVNGALYRKFDTLYDG